MAELPDAVRQKLDGHNWDDTIPRLLHHAEWKIRRLRWMGAFGREPPAGCESKDFVLGAIEKVFSGKRQWDPVKDPDLFMYLKSVVDSEISNLVRSPENQQSRESDLEPGTMELPDGTTPEAILLRKEEERQSEEHMLEILELLADEPDLQQIVTAIVDGLTKRSEIAKHLGITVKEFDARKKRLRRRLENFRTSADSPVAQI